MKTVLSRFLVFALVAVVLVTAIPTAQISATSAQREALRVLQERRRNAQSQVEEAREVLSSYNADVNHWLNVLETYSQRITDALSDLEEIELVLLETEIAMADAHADLLTTRADLEVQEELFLTRLRALHEQGPIGYLDVLLNATSFSDFLVRLEHVRSISQFDQQVLEDMAAAEARIATNVEELNRLNVLFEEMHIQQEIAIVALEEAEEASQLMVAEALNNQEQAEILLAVYEASERAILEEMGILERQIRAHEDAERAREQAARQAARQAQHNATLAELNNFNGQFRWPIPTHSRISSGFGPRTNPVTRRPQGNHNGIDVPAPRGTRIIAAADGVVRTAGWMGGFGQIVVIDHGGGYSTWYAHNSLNRVSAGQRVTAGQHIADVGTTGQSTGNHLHFEIRRNGTPINPMNFFR